MCGLLGTMSLRGSVDPGAFDEARDRMHHRGPDGAASWERGSPDGPRLRLGHRRLSVLDLTDAAGQPMSSSDGRCTMVFNGEIYNYLELREALEREGALFRSASDSEVLLEAWTRRGPECLDDLDGMFALAIWDEETRTLHLARDRFGEKPLYLHVAPDGRGFAFASEVKALCALPGIDPSPDPVAWFRWARFREVEASPSTLWSGITRLPPAHRMEVRATNGSLRITTSRWWDLPTGPVEGGDAFEGGAEEVRRLLDAGVLRRLRSDVPVGTSLSGGIDSSSIVCSIRELAPRATQKTFSARMDDPDLDEGPWIDRVLERTGLEGHSVIPTAERLMADFERLCLHMEEPFLSTSMFAQWCVMDLAAREQVTVLLDGQGADELFAGYRRYFRVRYAGLFAAGRWSTIVSERRAWRRRHDGPFPVDFRTAVHRVAPGLRALRRGRRHEVGASGRADDGAWSRDLLAAHLDERPQGAVADAADPLREVLRHDLTGGPLQDLLRYADRNAMAHSREVRLPFLEPSLVSAVSRMDTSWKLGDGETKRVLRRAMRGRVPDRILDRQDKLGYEAPLVAWLSGPLRSWARDRLATAAEDLPGFVRHDAADVLGGEGTVPEPLAGAVFRLLTAHGGWKEAGR